MKKVIKKSAPSISSYANFSTVALSKSQQKKLKGGDDSIIIVEVIEG